MFRGKVTFRYPDHDEVYEAGDAYYAPPGHIPIVEAGTEIVEFSPTASTAQTHGGDRAATWPPRPPAEDGFAAASAGVA